MGFLSSIKRLLFAQESVAKSAAEKTVEYAKDTVNEITNKNKTTSESSVKTSGLRESVLDKAEHYTEKIKDVAVESFEKTKEFAGAAMDKLGENEYVQKAGEISEHVGGKILSTGEQFLEKAEDISESVGSKIIHRGSDLMHKASEVSESVGSKVLEASEIATEKAKAISEQVGEKVLEAKDKLVEKAKEASENIGKKLDDVMDKAQKWEAEEALKPKKEFADETLTTGGDLLENKDDFFSKASQYADGHYDAFSEGKISITQPKPDNKPPTSKAAGFDDLDGDGNELIDDAIIVED